MDSYLKQISGNNTVRSVFRKTRRALSLLVVFGVFWGLKLTGITMAGEAFCGIQEHSHGEDCILQELICELEEAPAHVHTEECLHCPLPEQEGHTHSDDCVSKTLTCTLEESAGHIHGTDCFADTLVCTLPEEASHIHDSSCFTQEIGCGLEETEDHTHNETCLVSVTVCELTETEGHTHSEACYTRDLTCTLEEEEGHIHDPGCYTVDPGYICGKEEAQEHFHSEACLNPEEGHYFCGLEETEGHSHTEECYRVLESCPLEEHVHTAECYSDVSADVETSDDWEDSLSGLTRSPSTAENILMVARSQLGMAESTRNFQVGDDGLRRGITRYGQWYGNPYADWSAMFVSFCLDYAGVLDVPMNAGAESMRLGWEVELLYAPKTEYTPVPGQLLFLDKDENGSADAIAVITNLVDDVLFVIEGDLDEQVTQIGEIRLYPDQEAEEPAPEEADEELPDSVMETLYDIADPVVMGYGLVPFDGGLMLLPEGAARGAWHTVWLDGTNGGLMALGGSPNTAYTVADYTTFTLPTEWQSPDKYSYTLRGWYDVVNNKYYAPGDEVYINNQNLVFYADWAASTYDIGQYNAMVDDTVSTNDFVTVRMFDYGVLFNVLSQRANVSFGSNSHTETWNLITNGNNPYNGDPTLNFIFRDWDRGGEDISYPNGTNDRNNPTDAGTVYPGLYTNTIRDLLFDPGTEVIGKEYLGTGDHLFQLCLDPTHDHYGYYYYNSERNAASYNQSAQRFYVYNYLECTRDSAKSTGGGKYSDFLPLNSPYANANGKTVTTYTYAGVEGEYNGTTHYMYDAKYNTEGNTTNYVGTNYFFGMSMDLDFYIPNRPGATVTGGEYGNQDLYGNDMHFRFTGDDDVWVFVDGVMVLDLGGLHGRETGDINFSTGVVTVNGTVHTEMSNRLKQIAAGEHTLTLYYLERGSSMSNCAIYFNLAPRFSFAIQKEDVLTRDVLNGAQFSVFTDEACTVPAELWTSKAAHDRGEAPTNVFTVVNGVANMWGMGAGNTYYIKETAPPSDPDYSGLPNGVIRLIFDKTGNASYNVDVIDTGSGISGGFTVHGLRIDAETQQAYVIATNAPNWVQDTTTVQVRKQWQDSLNHNSQSITVYLTVTQPDGTVLRLREVELNSANNWQYAWDNLPKYWQDGTPIRYGVEESYLSGYYGKVEQVDGPFAGNTGSSGNSGSVSAVGAFENGGTYLLSTRFGYLTAAGGKMSMVTDQNTALSSDGAQWVAKVNSDGTVTLTSKAGMTLYYDNYTFRASTSPGTYKNLGFSDNRLYCYIDHGGWSETQYPVDGDSVVTNLTYNNVLYTTNNSAEAMTITPQKLGAPEPEEPETPADGQYYQITNIPLSQETSLTVQKHWDYGNLAPGTLHEQAQVTIRLLADGRFTGRTVTLSLRNGWRDTFRGLPYVDDNGNVITYTVEEVWSDPDWIPHYGSVVASNGTPPTYSASVTNRYRPGMGGPELPSTGSAARLMYILCGSLILFGSLVYGFASRRKRERRMK